ncbi:MAG: histidine phosphatase family protein [Chloroflexales bacterium]|nr:histidine phosphatase family protein [Chloroflexales bacterium]
MRLYFARHGESEANVLRVFSNRPGLHGLTERGTYQAEALGASLAGVRFAAIYSSPIVRAVQTAAIVAQRLNLPYQLDDALCEYDVGALEGRSDEASWTRQQQVFHAWMAGQQWQRGVDGGESYDDIRARFLPFIRRLEQAYQGSDNLLLIGHGGTFTCMLPLLLSNIDHAFCLTSRIPNTGYIVAERRSGTWIGVTWCGVPLSDAPGGDE